MHFSAFLAFRYFISKSQQNIINIITLISLGVVMVSTASLLVVLSAFSGLKDFGLSFSNAIDPDFKIIAAQGKTLSLDSLQIKNILALPEIIAVTPILEDKVFLSYQGKNQVAFLKGVGADYSQLNEIDSLIISGAWIRDQQNEVVIGGGIARNLSLGVYDFSDFLTLSSPKRKQGNKIIGQDFINQKALVSGIFLANADLDQKYLFSSLDFARNQFQRDPNEYSSLEVYTSEKLKSEVLQAKLSPLFKQTIVVKNRIQLNAALYKMLNTENIAVYLIFTLVLIIALFNVVGALTMMFLDKKPQLKILYAMGLAPDQIQRVFFYLGGFISWVGGAMGLVLGSALVLFQQHYPLLSVPGTKLAYPVKYTAENVVMVLLTLLLLGGLTSFWTTRKIHKKILL